jgi:hypothetical protein
VRGLHSHAMTSCCCDSPRSSYWYILSCICVNDWSASCFAEGRCENSILPDFVFVDSPVSSCFTSTFSTTIPFPSDLIDTGCIVSALSVFMGPSMSIASDARPIVGVLTVGPSMEICVRVVDVDDLFSQSRRYPSNKSIFLSALTAGNRTDILSIPNGF